MNPKQLLLLFFSLFLTITFSLNERFEACDAKTCGNGQNISYPFYIQGKQKPFCGQPGFELTCSHNGFPILTLMYTPYTIHQIFYDNQSLRVSNPVFSQPNLSSCIAPTQNLTVGRYRFRVAPNQRELFVLYGCDSAALQKTVPERRIWCSAAGNETTSVVGLDKGDRDLVSARESCKGGAVNATVDDLKGGVREALQRGFLLLWNATSCSECKSSGGRCGFDIDPRVYAFRCYCPDRPHAVKCTNTDPRKLRLIIGLASALMGGFMICIIICCTKSKSSTQVKFSFTIKNGQDIESFLKNHGALSQKRYKFSEVKKMTNSFKVKLGEGGFGAVYKGELLSGVPVAVKILNESKGNGEDFINEVASIIRTSHVNVVTLVGFCLEGRKKALIYEFMPNGSLDKFVYKKGLETTSSLSWDNFWQIAIGIARGLEYLHRGCNTRILHFDIKPHNILLDENFCPKISDFGLAKLCPRKESIISMSDPRGTIGYVAPEVWNRNFGGVSHKSDVYSYGMMLLEMVGGRKNINAEASHTSEIYFPHWIYNRLEQGGDLRPNEVMATEENEIVKRMTVVGLWCVQTFPKDRPTMTRVVDMLEGKMNSLEIPPKPVLSSPTRSVSESPTR
ncbi:hypothetical protein GLYMA_09G181960v4 [Glycine max]|uniref:non-specific serine/threonine protein kinase n=1 Tax=Glycine soja TaxID=3848 RepID=A0A445J2P9_GLYSO|nr:LEAF RUST 10 DISEASE-RESISTANCE LOCUS RECEPTOR-LIKE PROTEIN KINASE-like 2.7 isoform X2 [Glycine max]XP_028181876.1 LEAF RUST 10 DISEASE-RESISTANCE LOCUS RECEPTOR-LIKE PROTEIN KINASE-like 2.7 isoform X2 [Glycine soja]KAG4388473.1 hypothetical protein GLYMA_09G181960v4 [Glycine max]KAH1043583.1 hypothetical protein GYH30_025432 [Glycine max]RZB92619.1 LEAF RUST 10 DISEASE-RESISTANCE LOCUS RECEPTOR-LIKE PROTEIN KINASE-like 2.1 isoform A [Glycine soja]|eukprot:XP_014617731.1 LEAF RUST 10 DISEASE-RESISTANCE LOCUS RECEPTOR-LIKE PROTEIN KINASE-like 2.7 isoform X2 [Glycine max]